MAIPEPPQDDMKAPNEEEMTTAFDINKNYDPFSDPLTMEKLRADGFVVTEYMFDEGGNEIPFRSPSGTEVIEVDSRDDNPGGVEKRYLVYYPDRVEVKKVIPVSEPELDRAFGKSKEWEEIDTNSSEAVYVKRV